jgi:energy-converting hydrogenase Eha subunit C
MLCGVVKSTQPLQEAPMFSQTLTSLRVWTAATSYLELAIARRSMTKQMDIAVERALVPSF